MPALWERAVEHIKQNSPGVNPWAAATATLQKAGEMKKGARDLTEKGEKRQAKGPKWRHAHPLAIGGAAKAPSLGRPAHAIDHKSDKAYRDGRESRAKDARELLASGRSPPRGVHRGD